MIAGDANNPQFITKSDITLHLRPLRALQLQRFMIEWQRKNPRPDAPKYLMSNGEWGYSADDVTYLYKIGDWEARFSSEQANFILNYGIVTLPPSEWVADVPIFEDNPKLNWLYAILEDEDLGNLTQAILGIANATEQGVKDAEKN